MIGCQQRDIIERIFGWPKENRRLGTRYEKLPRTLPQRSPWLVRSDAYASIFVQNLGSVRKVGTGRIATMIDWRPHMARRYELPDAGWELIKDLVAPEQKMGRPRSDDRLVLNGIFWILCSGAAWRDLPERFGPWSTVYQRFRDWRDDGTFNRVLERLHVRLNQEGLIDLDTWMIDSTAVRATRASSGAGKKGSQKNR
jgi:transposase